MKNIIHEYYKKEIDDHIILIQLDPNSFKGLELIIAPDGQIKKTKRSFDKDIYDDLSYDEFNACSPIEFNLCLKGIK